MKVFGKSDIGTVRKVNEDAFGIKEIADIIGRTPSAVKMRLQKGRNLLKDKYRKEYM